MKMLCENGKIVDVEVKDSDPINLNKSIFITDREAESFVEVFNLNIYKRIGSRIIFTTDTWIQSIEFNHYPTENEIKYWLIKFRNNDETHTHGYYATVEKHYELKKYYD